MDTFSSITANPLADFKYALRAVQQQKWSEAYANWMFRIISLMNKKADAAKIIYDARVTAWYLHAERKTSVQALADAMEVECTEAEIAELRSAKANVAGNLIGSVEQLNAAPLQMKRAVLRSLPIITIPLACAYLGTVASTLHAFSDKTYQLIGGQYAGGYCLSIDELFLIAANPRWIPAITHWHKAPQVKCETDDTVFDSLLNVDENIACAFVDMTPTELRQLLRCGPHTRRPYRLLDLEKIRVSKLSAIQS